MNTRAWMNRIAYAPDDGAGSGDDSKTTFSAEYVRELRAEAKGLRLKLRGYEDEAPKLKQAAEDADKRIEAAVKEATKRVSADADARYMASELRGLAAKAGLVDMDALKVLDTSAIKLDDKGNLVVPDKFFEAAREAKPYLFKAQTGTETGTTSQTQKAPVPTPTTNKNVSAMTADELAAFERSIGL